MRCRKIQELLKSDYLDGEADQRKEKIIKQHLADCAQCRKLEEELRAQRAFLQSAVRPSVPKSLWQNIRQDILNQELKQKSPILERLKDYLFAPRPVFVLARVLATVIFVVVFFTFFLHKTQVSDNLSGLNGDWDVYSLNYESDNSLYSLGTDIEEYFL